MENIKETKNNVVTWVKQHKKGLIIGTGCIALAGVGAYFGCKALDTAETINVPELFEQPSKKFAPELAKYGVDGIYEYSGAWEFMTGQLADSVDGQHYPTKVGDIPEIVESFKAATGATDESDVYILMNVGKGN